VQKGNAGFRLSSHFLQRSPFGTPVRAQAPGPASRNSFALVIGAGSYPDAMLPIASAIAEARSLAEEARRNDFDAKEQENADCERMRRAIACERHLHSLLITVPWIR
jgi:hypothetical protein